MIIIPTYNSAGFIKRTIESGLDQTEASGIIVVDNGSSDETRDIAGSFDRVEVLVNSRNLGRIGNWNRCIEIAEERNADFFKILFAGDRVKPGAMNRYKEIFNTYPQVAVITSFYEIIESSGKIKVNRMMGSPREIVPVEGMKKNITIGNWYASPSVQAYRTDMVKNYRFDERLSWAADWKFCADINRKNNIFFLDEVLAEFVSGSRKYYSGSARKLKSVAEELYVQSDILEFLKDKISDDDRRNMEQMIKDKYAARFFTIRNFHRIICGKLKKI